MRVLLRVAVLLLVLLVLAASAWGFYRYKVQSELDQALAQLEPMLTVEYERLIANPFAQVRVEGVRITPMLQPPIPIRAVTLASNDLRFMIDPIGALQKGRWPEQISLQIEAVQLDTNAPLFQMADSLAQQQAAPGVVSMEALACGNVRRFDLITRRMMGMRNVQLDLHALMRTQANNRYQMELLLQMPGWGDTGVSLELQAPNAQLAALQAAQLREMRLFYQDGGYNQRKAEFCADQSGVEVAEYHQQHQQQWLKWLSAQSLQLPEALQDAYYALNQPDASLMVSVRPDMAALQLMSVDPEQLLLQLPQMLKVEVSGNPLQLSDSEWGALLQQVQEPALSQQTVPEPQPVPEEPALVGGDEVLLPPPMVMPEQPAVPARRPVPLARAYHHTPPQELGQYIGHQVRFYTYFGKRVEGVLVSVEDGVARVAERVHHGVAEYPVDISRLQTTEVYR